MPSPSRSRGSWRRSLTALTTALLVWALGAGPIARAEELGPSPWFPLVDPAKGAEETFALNTMELIRVGGRQWRVCRGKYRASMSRHDFFVTVGRPDLERQESSRRMAENALFFGGLGAALVGGGLLFAHADQGGFDPPVLAGVGVVVGGGVAILISQAFAGPALPVDEAEGLAVRYNERLKTHLDDGEKPSHVVATLQPRFAPWLTSGGGGVLAVATF